MRLGGYFLKLEAEKKKNLEDSFKDTYYIVARVAATVKDIIKCDRISNQYKEIKKS